MKSDTAHKRRSNKSHNHHDHHETTSSDDSSYNKNKANRGLNSMLLIAAGFVAIIFYTIWSSIRTYSEQLHYDME